MLSVCGNVDAKSCKTVQSACTTSNASLNLFTGVSYTFENVGDVSVSLTQGKIRLGTVWLPQLRNPMML